jgi:uncharacterized membrane protein YdjX (TVP38/TMEM64 family)
MSKNLQKYLGIIGTIFIILIFIQLSYFLQTNTQLIENNLSNGILGILLYIFITTFATVVAPISAIPLLPVAVYLWGWIFAAILSIIGWTLGSIIAFLLARKYGVPLVKKIVSVENISKYEKYIPTEKIFLSIIVMRLFLPVDVLSYILGLFSKVKLKTYALATLIGVTPFAFVLSYIGKLPIKYQILSFIIGGTILSYIMFKYHKKQTKPNKTKQNKIK